MLKPREGMSAGEPDSLGELFHRLVEDAKAYAQAEVNLYKTIGIAKLEGWKTPLILLAVAAFLVHAGLLTLVATLFVALAQVMNPALAGLILTVVLLAAAGILAKIGIARLRAPRT